MGIDEEILDLLPSENVMNAISDEKEIRRVILNCFCELLSQMKEFNKQVDEFNTYLSVVSSDKLVDFFTELKHNTEEEEKRETT